MFIVLPIEINEVMMNRKQFICMGAAAPFLAVGDWTGSRSCTGSIRFSADVPVLGDYDVAVFGAGPAGVGAAIAAARAGKKTILVEHYNFPGGVGTWGCMGIFFLFEDDPVHPTRQIVKGLADEVVRALDRRGAAHMMRNNTCEGPVPEPVGAQPLLGKVGYAPEDLKLVYHELLSWAGVEKLFMGNLAGAVSEGRRVTAAIVSCLEGPRAIRAKEFIDATGDAQLVHLAGGGTFQAAPEATMHKSMFADLCGVKPHDVTANKRRYRKLFAEGKLPDNVWAHMGFMNYAQTDHVQLPVTYAIGDNCSSADMTRMDLELRRGNFAVLDFYRREMPSYDSAYFVNSSVQVASRDGRHMKGRFVIDRDYLKGTVDAEDGVLPIRRQWGLAHSVKQKEGFSSKDIGSCRGLRLLPYRALVSADFDNVLAAGRALSANPDVMGACRMMTTCMAMGQVAGTAAALAIGRGLADVGAVPIEELKSRLENAGCVVS